MAITKEELDQKLLRELRSHGGEEAAELGREFIKLDHAEKLAMVTVMGLRTVLPSLDKADMMILTTAIRVLMDAEPLMCGLLCSTINEAVKAGIVERREKRNEKGDNDEQESN